MAKGLIALDPNSGRRLRAICVAGAALACCLGIWRGAEIFSQPAVDPASTSIEQQQLISLIEPITGAGTVRLTVRRSDAGTRSFLILIDRAGGAVEANPADIEALLSDAAGYNASLGDTLTIRQFPFAPGVSARPETKDLAELGGLGLLTLLLAWGAFAPSRRERIVAANETTPLRKKRPSTRRATPVDLPEQTSRTIDAARKASEDPSGTANVIRAWLHGPEKNA